MGPSPDMRSLKQRLEAAANDFVLGVLKLIREAPLHQLRELVAGDSLASAGRRPTRAVAQPRSESAPSARARPRPKRRKPAPKRQARPREAWEEAAPPLGDFDVTSPELLLVGEAGDAGARTREPPAEQPASPAAAGVTLTATPSTVELAAPAPPAPPERPIRAEPALRPGETVARSNGAGIVIRRDKRVKNRP